MRKYTAYTKQEDQIITQMNEKGFTPDEITKVLVSRSRSQIADRGYFLGLKWSKKPEINMAEFKRLMKEK
jgi:DNA-binding transcriptional MerR regulator